jgi:hypothetical protein
MWETSCALQTTILPFTQVPTSQIYKLHGFVLNLCENCYFISSYCLNMNVVHYLNMKVVCIVFVCKQHE